MKLFVTAKEFKSKVIKYFGEGDEAKAEAEAEEAAHVGDVVGEGDGDVPLDLLNVRVSDGDRDSKEILDMSLKRRGE
jgi:hypothetical protein